jgi:monoamine oxidase
MGLVRKTFPERTIPEPHIFKMYPWSSGCTYWLPGSYSPERVCDKALQVTDRIYACGESLAVRQGWVESALESASNMLAKIK